MAAGVGVGLPRRRRGRVRRGEVGPPGLDAEVVALLQLLPERVRLGEEVAGVEREDADGQLRARDDVDEQAVLGPEAVRERDRAPEARGDRGQDRLRRLAFQPPGELADLVRRERAHRIIPAPTVSLVASSTTMKAPVARFSA